MTLTLSQLFQSNLNPSIFTPLLPGDIAWVPQTLFCKAPAGGLKCLFLAPYLQ